ncbi:MAG: hypothetical protein WCP24_01935 [bacterium]
MINEIVEIPITITRINSKINIVSFKTPRIYFNEPFFIDSLVKNFNILQSQIKLPNENELLSRPVHYEETSNQIVNTPIEKFIEKFGNSTSVLSIDEKIGFIFHMSRCGSTLFTQMLTASNKFFVLSEPTIINAVLDPALEIDESTRIKLLKACINALNSCAPITSERTIIKFRSWNTLFIDMISGCFKDIPWVFIHRNGIEVLASVLKKPPGWLRSKNLYTKYFSKILNTEQTQINKMPLDEFAIKLLGKFCSFAKDCQVGKKKFIEYFDIKKVFPDIIKVQWNIELTQKEKDEAKTISSLYSKDTEKKELFTSDTEEKQNQITDKQKELVLELLESQRNKLIN